MCTSVSQKGKETMAWHPLPIFVYGTLKRDQPNFYLFESKKHGKSEFIGRAVTMEARPLVVDTPFYIPFLLDTIGRGHVCSVYI